MWSKENEFTRTKRKNKKLETCYEGSIASDINFGQLCAKFSVIVIFLVGYTIVVHSCSCAGLSFCLGIFLPCCHHDHAQQELLHNIYCIVHHYLKLTLVAFQQDKPHPHLRHPLWDRPIADYALLIQTRLVNTTTLLQSWFANSKEIEQQQQRPSLIYKSSLSPSLLYPK